MEKTHWQHLEARYKAALFRTRFHTFRRRFPPGDYEERPSEIPQRSYRVSGRRRSTEIQARDFLCVTANDRLYRAWQSEEVTLSVCQVFLNEKKSLCQELDHEEGPSYSVPIQSAEHFKVTACNATCAHTFLQLQIIARGFAPDGGLVALDDITYEAKLCSAIDGAHDVANSTSTVTKYLRGGKANFQLGLSISFQSRAVFTSVRGKTSLAPTISNSPVAIGSSHKIGPLQRFLFIYLHLYPLLFV